MKALQYLSPKNLQFADLPIPEISEHEVLLKISKVGICGTDLHIYTGGMKVSTPLVMGHEFVGIVEKVGGSVHGVSVGDRAIAEHVIGCGECQYCRMGKRNVCVNPIVLGLHRPGALAEYMVVPGALVTVLPESVSLDAGVLAEPLSIAVYAALKANTHSSSSIAVIGQGPIGLLVDFITKNEGGTVYGFDRHDNRLSYALESGYITKGFNVSQEHSIPAFLEETNGGADIVFEAVGSDSSADLALQLACPGGSVVVLGVFQHDVMVNMMNIVRKELSVFGSWTSIGVLQQTVSILQDGKLDPSRFITHRYPFSDAPLAFEDSLTDKGQRIKTVIEFS